MTEGIESVETPGEIRYNLNWVVAASPDLEIRSRDINAAIEAAILDQGLVPIIAQTRSLTDEEAPQVWIGETPESGGRAVDVRELVDVFTRVADWGGIEKVKELLQHDGAISIEVDPNGGHDPYHRGANRG